MLHTNTKNLTRFEYSQARELASQALLAFNTGDHDALSLVVSRALDNHGGAKEYGRDASVIATWSALAHTATLMARGNAERASVARETFYGCLESAKRLARGDRA